MDVKLSELRETKQPLRFLMPYPEDKPEGFYDTDGKFMVTVLHKGIVMKKHIVKKYTKVETVKLS